VAVCFFRAVGLGGTEEVKKKGVKEPGKLFATGGVAQNGKKLPKNGVARKPSHKKTTEGNEGFGRKKKGSGTKTAQKWAKKRDDGVSPGAGSV